MRMRTLCITGALVIITLGQLTTAFAQKHSGAFKNANVVLITLDALRPDHMGCYGYERNTTPNIDRIAKESVVFNNAFTNGTWTAPSLGALVTSLYPHQTYLSAVGKETGKKLSSSVKTLAESMSEDGYKTAVWYYIAPPVDKLGFLRGFQHIAIHPTKEKTQIASWINENKNKRFFLWLHYLSPHCPYSSKYNTHFMKDIPDGYYFWKRDVCEQKGKDIPKKELDYRLALYDGKLLAGDEEVGFVRQELEKAGVYDNTVLMISSDHGEEFHEHGMCDHGHALYDEVIRIPLIVRLPQQQFVRTVDSQVRLIDIMPTVLDMAGLASPYPLEGESLLPWMSGKRQDDLTLYTGFTMYGGRKFGIRKNDTKFIVNRKDDSVELYDLSKDPGETTNLSSSSPEKVQAFRKELSQWLSKKAELPAGGKSETYKYTDTEIKKLHSLGYM